MYATITFCEKKIDNFLPQKFWCIFLESFVIIVEAVLGERQLSGAGRD